MLTFDLSLVEEYKGPIGRALARVGGRERGKGEREGREQRKEGESERRERERRENGKTN